MDWNGMKRKTVKTVSLRCGISDTRLKPGANEKPAIKCLRKFET